MERKSKLPKGERRREDLGFASLPIYRYRRKLVEAVQDNLFLVVTGETGSGKTTQLPKYLFEEGFAKHGLIGVTQPRRVAATSVAQRVAEEMGCPLGSVVGYQVRFDECVSEETLIKYMTDGCLLRQILADPHLARYSIVILDEAHERSLSTDILFGLLKQMFHGKELPGRMKPLKVVIMSATLDTDKFSAFFDCCPVVDIPGRNYPVEEIFCGLVGPRDAESPAYVTETVKVTLDIHLTSSAGDILVFLTGQSEIEKTCELLFQKAESVDYRFDVRDCSVEGLLILPLYGSMPTDQQRRIFLPPPPGIRKCVVSTNIAATSLTIDGIRYVVDSGFVKQLNHNPRVGLDMLEVVPISKSEALQRAGRAGRTSSGKCYRIYSKEFWEQCMPDHMVPEIRRTSLTSVILTLKCLAIHDVIRFPYLDRPEERRILEALKQLYQCNAIDRRGYVTKLGEFMVRFPLPPNLTCAVIKAASLGCEDLLLPIAAMLSVEKVFIRPGDPQSQKEAELRHQELSLQAGGCNDFATLLNVFEQCKASKSPSVWCQENWVHWRALKLAFSVEGQLREITNKLKQLPGFPREHFDGSRNEILRRCLCAGYFANIARRSIGKSFCTMDGHGSMVYIHPSSALREQEAQLEWILFHDVLVTSKVYVRTVCPVRYEWVQDLLPRLHKIDAYELSSMAREEVTEEEMVKWRDKEDLERRNEKTTDESAKKLKKRNDDQSIKDARARYLERKQQRTQELHFSSKDTS
ncbi:probable ATP-dependent RNA helicase DHX40 isoform X3 [Rhineura floridana]|nr:probable ATP-dependent RNA helicase DHX40 isoform X3 [Rhineura floridana]XP_061460687.1 probable ATP-dependent RNA helicase DHX40 isoform X3 [Rhineura floridana]XP_061460688.1 probable ATP-dependent RNA helicase DHX40 isoform X3 [Rhineura floridana]XP_061460689.1 probable ATP-dependent RNA helicase DHX40 isoform X3 [Rhineura floridana]XP_061460690.1 probable ATP-dependent RNA helicase DHX40 isoform X3 [Rhineura floridana]XP_061460691.1 probable ATP-dependent RNA helicase DHX40 isoform X3 [R